MNLNKIIFTILFSMIISLNLFAKKEILIDFKNLEIKNFIKITSKILNKNILISSEIKGKVEFITNKKVYKEDILNILIYVLESKGYTLIENENILRIVRLSDAPKYNVSGSNKKKLKDVEIIDQDLKKDIQIVNLKNIQGRSILGNLKFLSKNLFNEKIEKEKVSILLNKNNNSIMFIGMKKNVDFLVNYTDKIDKSGSLVEKTIEVIGLKNAESKNVIKIINGIISVKVYKNKNDILFASMDNESNSIILMGPNDELDYFKRLIKKLDVDRQQVYVKARIIEISEKATSNMGIKYGLKGLINGGDSTLTFAGNLGGPSFGLSNLTSSAVSLPKVRDGLILGASINLLRQNYALDLVSEPSLLCINNKESSIYVGESRSILTGTTVGTTTTTNYKREDIGLTLKVKPRISNGNKVTLEISTIMEDIVETNAIGQPNTNKKEVKTTAIVTNGESVILGGLTKHKKESTVDKVPFFGDIPFLGSLFRNKSELNDKINLVIIITPYIIPKSEDLSYIRNQLSELKLLEDKYTKETLLRLEKAKLRAQKENIVREEKIIDLKQNLLDSSELKNFDESEIVLENKILHQQRIKEIFGI